MWEKTLQTVKAIKNKIDFTPEYGVVLGSGLGNFISELKVLCTIPYQALENFPIPTVQGHEGQLLFGTLGTKKVVVMQGRFHYYEGYSMQEITFPIRVMKLLGISKLLVTNAAGGINPNYEIGSIVVIKDHVNALPEHPLRGANDERFGPRFVNMTEPYSLKMIKKAKEIALNFNIPLHEGVYVALQGPTYETPAEYRMIKAIGGDCVGMSTVPEIIVAKHMNIETFGVSVITDTSDQYHSSLVSHQEVVKAAHTAEPLVSMLLQQLILQY